MTVPRAEIMSNFDEEGIGEEGSSLLLQSKSCFLFLLLGILGLAKERIGSEQKGFWDEW